MHYTVCTASLLLLTVLTISIFVVAHLQYAVTHVVLTQVLDTQDICACV
jgi:hypothetical protein